VRVDRATFRFLAVAALNARLPAAGVVVEAQDGDDDGMPFSLHAAEIVSVAALRHYW